MVTEQIAITVTTPAGSRLTIARHGTLQSDNSQTSGLFSAMINALAETSPDLNEASLAAAGAIPVVKKPWEDLTDPPTGLNFKPPADLHAKMNWVSKNVPGGISRLQILRDGAMAECDRLIALHYKE